MNDTQHSAPVALDDVPLFSESDDDIASVHATTSSPADFGVYPAAVFDLTQASVDNLVAVYRAATGG